MMIMMMRRRRRTMTELLFIEHELFATLILNILHTIVLFNPYNSSME